jgi:hypothetical protein
MNACYFVTNIRILNIVKLNLYYDLRAMCFHHFIVITKPVIDILNYVNPTHKRNKINPLDKY